MAKAKLKSIISVADGAGGLAQVQDRRFEQRDWPIRFDVVKDQADTWLQHLSAECGRRSWSCAGISQMEAGENSGSLTINTGGPTGPKLAVVWERKHDRPLKVRARSSGTPEFPLDQANEFFREINGRSGAGATEQFHRVGQLCYDGLPWRGELWLDDTLRLGPPSQQDDRALVGPRIVLVSALIKGIDFQHATSVLGVTLREVSVFLTVVMGDFVRVSPSGHHDWSWRINSEGHAECEIRNLGYFEKHWPEYMPSRGEIQAVPLEQVARPDFSIRGIDGSQTELHLPDDTLDLWKAFSDLSPDQRKQFLRAGSMWQRALSHGHEHATTRFAFMVAACDALKPPDRQFRDHNIYHVAEALLGKPIADELQEPRFRPQEVRNAHFHGGEFRGTEFVPDVTMSSFQDPTFDQSCRRLYEISQAAIIEWLRLSGKFTMPPLKRRRSWRRLVKDHVLFVLPVVAVACAVVGIILGWFLGTLRSG